MKIKSMRKFRSCLASAAATAFAVAFATGARAGETIDLEGNFTTNVERTCTSDTTVNLKGVTFTDCTLKLAGNVTFTLNLAEGTQNTFRMLNENDECIKATKQSNIVIDGTGSLELLSEKRITDKDERSGVLVCNNLTVRNGDVKVTFDNNKNDTSCIFLKGNYLQTGGKVKLDLHKKNCTNELHGVTFDNAGTTFTLEDGEFSAEIAGTKSRAIDLKKSGSAYFKGGKVKAEFEGPEGRFVSGGALIEFSGGSYKFTTNVTEKMTAAYYPANLSAVKAQNAIRITGGTFKANLPLVGSEVFTNDSEDGTDITIEGGEFDLVAGDDCVSATRDILVSGGTFVGTSVFDDVLDANNDLTISGGDIRAWATAPGTHAFDVNSKKKRTLTISGGIVIGTDGLGAIKIGEDSDEVGKKNFIQNTYYGTVETSEYRGRYILLEGATNGVSFAIRETLPRFADDGDFNLLASIPERSASKPEPMFDGEVGVAAFVVSRLSAAEGSVLKIDVAGGNETLASSVQVQASYLTATAADLNLKGATVDGETVKSFKFPFKLEWGKGEVGTKTIEIPVVADKAVEADERMSLELLNPVNMAMGDNSFCAVTITDPTYHELKKKVEEGTATDAEKKVVEKADAVFAGKVLVTGRASDATRGKVTGSALVAKGRNATLKAAANKGWVFAGWYDDDPAAAEPVSLLASLVVPASNDVGFVARFVSPAEDSLSLEDGFLPAAVWKGREVSVKVPVESVSLPTVTVSGLPGGLKYYAKETVVKATSKTPGYVIPANTIFGTVTAKAAKKPLTVTVTVKNLGGYQIVRKYEMSVVESAPAEDEPAEVVSDAAPFHAISLSTNDGLAGSVSGAGVFQEGKKVTLKATPAKGFVFNGWYPANGDASAAEEWGESESQAASWSFEMPESELAYVARFVTAEEDKGSIALKVNGLDFSSQPTNVMAGVYLAWPVAASALSEPTVKVSGLPSGLKFTAKDILKKGSKTEVEIPANTIYGAPTAASKVNSKTGEVTPSKVKVSVTTAGKSKAEYQIDLTVDPLPAWAVGDFSGLAISGVEGRYGSASITVSAAGKVSGKVIVNGTNCTFSAASYDISSRTVGTTQLVIVAEGKVGKALSVARLSVTPESAFGVFDCVEMVLYRNVWKDKGAEPVPERLRGLYTVKLHPEVSSGLGTGYLSLTVDKKGAVKVTGKAPDGTALSAAATLMPWIGEGVYFVDVFAAPSAYKGGSVAGSLYIGRMGERDVSSPDSLWWTSRNPESTKDYDAGGFIRPLTADGYWYSNTELDTYYEKLAFEAPNRGVDQACWSNLTVSADDTGGKFVVDQKKTTPVQDKVTKKWSYEGANDAALEISFAKATGIWKGSFLWWSDEPKHASTKVPFEGILVQGDDLEGFGTFDATSSYVPVDKKGNPQKEKTYKYKESVPVVFRDLGE